MFQNSLRCLKAKRPAFRRRRGAVALLSLGALVLILGAGALALNLAWLTSHQTELRQACESAALAGAAQLLDPAPQDSASPTAVANTAARAAAAVEKAQAFFTGNSRAMLRVTGGDPDVVLGWCETPTLPRSNVVPWTGAGPVNAISVRGKLRRSSGQSVVMWFGNLFGVLDAEPAAAATATLDQRIYGFRPVKFVAVPLVPLLAFSADDWPSAALNTLGDHADNFLVDERTGSVAAGSDGIGEITLRVALADGSLPEGSAGAAWLVLLPGPANFTAIAQQVESGLEAADLETLGGQLALQTEGSLVIAGTAPPNAMEAAVLRAALLSIRGQRRLWPLGHTTVADGQLSCTITSFAAGRVVDCQLDETTLTLIVQAATLQTCTGLLRTGAPRNPWIGKLLLNQ